MTACTTWNGSVARENCRKNLARRMLPQVEHSFDDVKSRISSNLPDFAHDTEILQVPGPRTMHVSLIC